MKQVYKTLLTIMLLAAIILSFSALAFAQDNVEGAADNTATSSIDSSSSVPIEESSSSDDTESSSSESSIPSQKESQPSDSSSSHPDDLSSNTENDKSSVPIVENMTLYDEGPIKNNVVYDWDGIENSNIIDPAEVRWNIPGSQGVTKLGDLKVKTILPYSCIYVPLATDNFCMIDIGAQGSEETPRKVNIQSLCETRSDYTYQCFGLNIETNDPHKIIKEIIIVEEKKLGPYMPRSSYLKINFNDSTTTTDLKIK